ARRVSDALGVATEQRAMRNYAGHRLAPWLAHVMVSRQETARPLLTQGEVMQLPSSDELVMISGMAPIRACKLRYFEDHQFAARRFAPPRLIEGTYRDRPRPRPDDWGRCVCLPVPAFAQAIVTERQASDTDGGPEQQRHPGHEAEQQAPAPIESEELAEPEHDEGDVPVDQKAMDRARTALLRAQGLSQGPTPNLFPET
ncbi:MAG: conjugal transfer protein TraG, partial [Sphingomonadales bacterium]